MGTMTLTTEQPVLESAKQHSTLAVSTVSTISTVSTVPTVKTKSDYHVKTSIPQVQEAARVARSLVQRESLGNLALIDNFGDAISFSEYYVDIYKNGSPYLIILKISSVNQILKNMDVKKVGFSIRTGDHQPQENVDLHYPGGLAYSTAGSPRVVIKGELKYILDVDRQEEIKMEKEFIKRHRDAKFWLPSSKITAHKGNWAKLEINSIYFIGGFGDRAYIGNIPVDMYHDAIPYSDEEFRNYFAECEEKSIKFDSLINGYSVPQH